MGRQMLKYYVGLVGLGIIVGHASGFGTVFSAGSKGVVDLTNSFKS